MTGVLTGAAVLFGVAILLTLAEALRRGEVAASVNAAVSLGAAVFPAVVGVVVTDVRLGPELPLWAAAAGFLHSLGMLGLYESTWWWDHLTHTVSAGLVAALAYAAAIVLVRDGTAVPLSLVGVAGLAVGFVLVVGVFWELVELLARDIGERYDVEPVLVHYGRRDTALDLVFDLVGALAVVGLDVRTFLPLAERHPDGAVTALLAAAAAAVAGSVLAALVVVTERS